MKTTRRLLIVLLSVLTVFAVAMSASCKKDDKNDSSSSATEQTGISAEFYFDGTSESGAMTITLKLAENLDWELDVNGTKTSGKYELEGNKLTLSAGDSILFEITYNVDTVQLAYNGVTYTLVPDKMFTVTFPNLDDYATKVVRYGKTIELTDPAKEGYRFVGWYTDAAFKNAFDKSEGIRSNLELYAKFIAENAEEYVVKYFKNGNLILETATEGKALANMPSDSGEGFLGWWGSDAQDATKLTRKYTEGEELKEDTYLFAVYKTAAPALNVTADGVRWEGDANAAYTLYITAPGSTEKTQYNVSGKSVQFYDFARGVKGEYVIELKAESESGSATSRAYYINKRLARPSGLKISGNELTFASVENAASYTLEIECGKGKHTEDLGNSLSYDFTNCEMTAAGVKFTVTANAEDYVSSSSITLELNRSLEAVTGVTYAQGKVTWAPVANAEYYNVTLTRNGQSRDFNELTEASLDVGFLPSCEFTVKVSAHAACYNSAAATEATLEKAQLATPTGFTYYLDNSEFLKWDKVDGAIGYEITVHGFDRNGAQHETWTIEGGDELSMTITSTKLSQWSLFTDEYTFELVAKAQLEGNNSLKTTLKLKNNALLTAEDFSYENGVLSWTQVRRVSKYTLTLPDGSTATAEEAKYTAPITFTHAGTNYVTVSYNGNNCAFGIEAYAVVFETNGTEVDTIYKANGDLVTLPGADEAPERFGYTFGGWYDSDSETGANRYGDSFRLDTDMTFTVYAGWVPNKYTVTLDVDGGDALDPSKSSLTIGYRTNDTLFPIPGVGTRTAGQFFGWYSEKNGGGIQYADQFGKMVNRFDFAEDVTFYAYWPTIFEFKEYTNEQIGLKGYQITATKDIDKFKGGEITVPATHNGTRVICIPAYAFQGGGFKRINIPQSVYEIQILSTDVGSAFQGCRYLEEINVYPVEGMNTQEMRYFSEDGVLYFENEDYVTDARNNTELAYVPLAKTGKITVSDQAEIIPLGTLGSFDGGNSGYSASHKFTEVEIPYSIRTIAEKAFVSNSNLKSVAFLATPAGKTAPDLEIGAGAFEDCGALTEITFPKRLTTFDPSVFGKCLKLSDIYFEIGNADYTSVDGVVLSADQTKLIYYPRGRGFFSESANRRSYTIPETVEVIGTNAFSGSAVRSVTIGANVKTIEDYAFSGKFPTGDAAANLTSAYYTSASNNPGCIYLETLIFEGRDRSTLTIGEGAFSMPYYVTASGSYSVPELGKLTEVVLPRNLSKLGAYAFAGRIGLHDVTLTVSESALRGAPVEYANSAFSYNGLFTYTYYTNPTVQNLKLTASVPLIENLAAVFGSSSLKDIRIDEANKEYEFVDQVLYNKDVTKMIYYLDSRVGDYELPESVTEIPDAAFNGKSNVTKVIVHDKVTYIGADAFKNCVNLVEVEIKNAGEQKVDLKIGANAFSGCKKLGKITLSDRLVEMGDGVFGNCEALVTIELPASLERFGTYGNDEEGNEVLVSLNAFEGCKALETITVASGNKHYLAADGVLYGGETDEASAFVAKQLIVSPVANSGEITVPSTVTKVWTNAFNGNTGITKITFASGDGSVIKEIDAKAFYNCKALAEVILPKGLEILKSNTFENCRELAKVTIPCTVSSIETSVFSNCSKLSVVEFEETGADDEYVELALLDGKEVTTGSAQYEKTTYYGAFAGCASLETIVFPERLVSVGAYTFVDSGIVSIEFPSTLRTLGESAFYNANRLKEVVFKNRTEEVDGKTVVVPSELKDLPAKAFFIGYGTNSLERVVLPEGLVTIGYQAFRYCSKLTEITIPSTVTDIGASYTNKGGSVTTIVNGSAFEGCSSLAKVTFAPGSKLETIGDSSFSGTAFTSITLPATLKKIGKSAFSGSKLKQITFETNTEEVEGKQVEYASIESFGESAFGNTPLESFVMPTTKEDVTLGARLFTNCKKIKEVYISASVMSIDGVFDGCKSSYSLTVDENNPSFKVDPNLPLILSVDGKTIIKAYAQIKPANGILKLAEGYEVIEQNAFASQSLISKLILPSSIKTIRGGAFNKCLSLAEVEFALDANGESRLGNIEGGTAASGGQWLCGAFEDCTSLKLFTFPASSGLKVIGGRTFNGCDALESIVIPEGVEKLGEMTGSDSAYNNDYYGVLSDCAELKSVTLPESLKGIYDQAFAKSPKLSSIEIPGNVEYIGNFAFNKCTALESVTFKNKKNTNAKSLETIGQYAFAETAITEISIPSTVKLLGFVGSSSTKGYVFDKCAKLETITFETRKVGEKEVKDLETVGNYAFQSTAIKSIDLTGATKLGTYLFSKCANLTSVTLDDSLTSLPDYMLSECTSFTGEGFEFPSKLVHMGIGTFQKCTALKTMTIPAGVKNLLNTEESSSGSDFSMTDFTKSSSLFDGCTALESVKFLAAPQRIGGYAFRNCSMLTSVTAPDGKGEYTQEAFFANLLSVSNYAFASTGLTEVNFVDLERLGTQAFAGSAITSLTFGKAVEYNGGTNGWGSSAFMNCKNLKTLELPGQTYFGSSAFSGCTALTSVKFAKGTNAISGKEGNLDASTSSSMFKGCTKLATVTFEEPVTLIAGSTFENCSALTTITNFFETVETLGSRALYNTGLTTATFEALETINTYALGGNTKLTSVTFKKDLTGSGGSLLSSCTNLTSLTFEGTIPTTIKSVLYNCNKLATVTVSDSMTSLPAGFLQNTAIKTFRLPKSLASFDYTWFTGSTIEAFEIDEGASKFSVKNGVLFDKAGTKLICVPANKAGALDLSGITDINANAFYNCSKLTEVTFPKAMAKIPASAFTNWKMSASTTFSIPSGITEIGASAFKGSTLAGDIVIPETVTSIGASAFENTNITGITLPAKLKTIGASAFKGTDLAGKVTIPETVTSIGASAFENTKIEGVTLPSKLTKLENAVFKGTALTGEINLPETLTAIGDSVFENTKITAVKLGSKITSIGKSAFSGTELTEITLPGTLTSIGETAFKGTSLGSVVIPKNVTSLGKQAFAGIKTLTELTIEEGVKSVGTAVDIFRGAAIAKVTLPSTLTAIPQGMLAENPFTTITLPAALTSLGGYVFEKVPITEIALPEGLKTIGASAFAGVGFTMTKLELPEGLTTLGASAFAGKARTATDDGYDYEGCSAIEEIVLPSTLTTIDTSAFENLYQLYKVNLENVQTIKAKAFAYAGAGRTDGKQLEVTFGALTSVTSMTAPTISKDNVLTKDGTGAFMYSTLRKVTFTKASAVKGQLLYQTNELEEVVLPQDLTELPSYMFAYSGLKKYTMPAHITGAAKNTYYHFKGCLQLEEFSFGNSTITELPMSFFENCASLKKLELPKDLTSIASSAFNYTTSLKELVIPENATCSVGAFRGWTSDQILHFKVAKDSFAGMFTGSWNNECNARLVFDEEAELAIGDADADNDDVSLTYVIADALSDGYVVKASLTAEKAAKVSGRTFTFALALVDPATAETYTETVLYTVKGDELEATKDENGNYGNIDFTVKLEKLSDYFEATEGEGTAKVYFVLHDDTDATLANRKLATGWTANAYDYAWDGEYVVLSK